MAESSKLSKKMIGQPRPTPHPHLRWVPDCNFREFDFSYYRHNCDHDVDDADEANMLMMITPDKRPLVWKSMMMMMTIIKAPCSRPRSAEVQIAHGQMVHIATCLCNRHNHCHQCLLPSMHHHPHHTTKFSLPNWAQSVSQSVIHAMEC